MKHSNEQGRETNSVASALILDRLASPHQNNIEVIRLFCDSCIGQNKNFPVWLALSML